MTPRERLENPDLFGKTPKAIWSPVSSSDPVQVAAFGAAYMQHMFACQVAEALREEGGNAMWLAEQTGLNHRHLSHVLRGRQVVTLATMIAITLALDRVELFPAPASLADMIPWITSPS